MKKISFKTISSLFSPKSNTSQDLEATLTARVRSCVSSSIGAYGMVSNMEDFKPSGESLWTVVKFRLYGIRMSYDDFHKMKGALREALGKLHPSERYTMDCTSMYGKGYVGDSELSIYITRYKNNWRNASL